MFLVSDKFWTVTAVHLGTRAPSQRHFYNVIIVYRCLWAFTLLSPSVVNFFPINFCHFSLTTELYHNAPSVSCLLKCVACIFPVVLLWTWPIYLQLSCASAASALSLWWYFFLSVCFFHRSLTSNLPNVNLPNVNLPKVPNLPVNIPLGIPQMPTFSAPSWMAAIYDAECVFSSH